MYIHLLAIVYEYTPRFSRIDIEYYKTFKWVICFVLRQSNYCSFNFFTFFYHLRVLIINKERDDCLYVNFVFISKVVTISNKRVHL